MIKLLCIISHFLNILQHITHIDVYLSLSNCNYFSISNYFIHFCIHITLFSFCIVTPYIVFSI